MQHYIPDEIVESRNEQMMRIRLINGSQIQILGSDNFDNSLVGTNAVGMVFSEYALQDPRAWSFSIPILKASNGWALFVSTTRGKNHFYDLYNAVKDLPDWFCEKITVEDTKHISLEEIEKEISSGQISRDLALQEFWCFPKGQQILSEFGLVNIEDVKEASFVFSHSGRLRRVLATSERLYSGDLIQINTYGSYEPLVCTENHPIRVYNKNNRSYSWKEASLITDDDRLVYPKKILSGIKVISYELCMLIAWYICDGSSSKNCLQFTVRPDKAKRIEYLLNALNIKHSTISQENIVDFFISNCGLVDFFNNNCGSLSYNKRIPFSLIIGFESAFFIELMMGDGCYSEYRATKKYVFTTTSKSLAYQIQFLAHSLNKDYSAGITKRDAGTLRVIDKYFECAECYTINIHFKGPIDSALSRSKYSINAKIKSIEKIPYGGPVYNLKIQYDSSYIVAGRAVHNCDFNLGVEGSYYGKYIDDLRRKGQLTQVMYEPYLPVYTVFDLGYNDPTVILFVQLHNNQIRIIDYYENNKKGLDHYAKVLKEKPYAYAKHVAPFDIAVHDLSTGISRWKMMHDLGISFMRYSEKAPSIEDGIEAVRRALPRVWIDEKTCEPLIKALENYRQEFDNKKKVYKSQPLHDNNSHAADAMRYLCVALPKLQSNGSPEEINKRYNEVMYGVSDRPGGFFSDDRS